MLVVETVVVPDLGHRRGEQQIYGGGSKYRLLGVIIYCPVNLSAMLLLLGNKSAVNNVLDSAYMKCQCVLVHNLCLELGEGGRRE